MIPTEQRLRKAIRMLQQQLKKKMQQPDTAYHRFVLDEMNARLRVLTLALDHDQCRLHGAIQSWHQAQHRMRSYVSERV